MIYSINKKNERIVKRSIEQCEKVGLDLEVQGIWNNTIHKMEDLNIPIKDSCRTIFQDFKNMNFHSKIRKMIPSPQKNQLPMFQQYNQIRKYGLNLKKIYNQVVERLNQEQRYEHDTDQIQFKGGEKQGIARLNEYIFEQQGLDMYSKTKMLLYGKNASSKMSPWISNGCVSSRYVYYQVLSWAEEQNMNQKAIMFLDHLFIKDYWLFKSTLYTEEQLIGEYGVNDNKQDFQWNQQNNKYIERLRNFRCGVPIVDACMKELSCNGYCTNKARQILSNYISVEMNIDWRLGLQLFQENLIDFEFEQSTMSWQNLIGFLAKRYDKTFYAQFQQAKKKEINCLSLQLSKQYDPNGQYIKKWLPELANVPQYYIHNPWKLQEKGIEYEKYIQQMYVIPSYRIYQSNGNIYQQDQIQHSQYDSNVDYGYQQQKVYQDIDLQNDLTIQNNSKKSDEQQDSSCTNSPIY